MAEPNPNAQTSSTPIDWEYAEAFLRKRIRAKIGNADDPDVDDLVQDALVRLLRTLRRVRAQNLEALMNSIGHRTVVDHLRTRARWAAVRRGAGARDVDSIAVPPRQHGDPIERGIFMVLEFFRKLGAPCHELARAYFSGQESWVAIARRSGKTPEAIRQQWWRCVQALRSAAQRDEELLPHWPGGETDGYR